MAEAAGNLLPYPFAAFNFSIEITREDESAPLVNAAFSECDGLEMTMEVKTIREGGKNDRQIRLAGPLACGQLALKRGMTSNFGLWKWMSDTVKDPSLRAEVVVVLFARDGQTECARFLLSRCLPIKLKAPPLNAKEGILAVEELQIAYESLILRSSKS